jgi:hypothetical protein
VSSLPKQKLDPACVTKPLAPYSARGREFYNESKHEETFIHDVDDRDHPVTIMGEDDVSPFVWRIQVVSVNDQPKNDWEGRDPLTVHVVAGAEIFWRLISAATHRHINLAFDHSLPQFLIRRGREWRILVHDRSP